jgi:transposase
MERGIKRLRVLRIRREKAIALFNQGERQATVAATLRVSRQSTSRWYNDWLSGNTQAIQGASRAGRKRRLTTEQIELIRHQLLQGAKVHGYPSDLWTLPRIARLIEVVTKVHYHPGHVWKVLKQMGWSLQRPTLRAKERDEEKISHWKNRIWAEVKKRQNLEGVDSFP